MCPGGGARQIASHILKFMWTSLDGKFIYSYPVAHFLVDSTSANELYTMATDGAAALHAHGFTCTYMVCDGAGQNRAFHVMCSNEADYPPRAPGSPAAAPIGRRAACPPSEGLLVVTHPCCPDLTIFLSRSDQHLDGRLTKPQARTTRPKPPTAAAGVSSPQQPPFAA